VKKLFICKQNIKKNSDSGDVFMIVLYLRHLNTQTCPFGNMFMLPCVNKGKKNYLSVNKTHTRTFCVSIDGDVAEGGYYL
jgi:hypothetical protein